MYVRAFGKVAFTRGEQLCGYFRQRSVSIIYSQHKHYGRIFPCNFRHIEFPEPKISICIRSYFYIEQVFFFLPSTVLFVPFSLIIISYYMEQIEFRCSVTFFISFYFYANFQVSKYIFKKLKT